MSDTRKSTAPAAKVSLYPLAAAIWRNQNPKGVFYSVTFERSYKDEAGKYQTSTTIDANHLLLLSKLADLCDTKIRELRAADRQAGQSDEEAA